MTDDSDHRVAAQAAEFDNPFSSVPIDITVSVGKARPTIRELLRLGPDSVLSLDRQLDDAVELYVGERLIARGELEAVEEEGREQLTVRLTEVADLRDGVG
jgi:flagellar motor switch protein FliN/FliY